MPTESTPLLSSNQHDSQLQLVEYISHFSSSLALKNTGSVARDHLANERTFLAWVRTSLSTISVGVGITQLFRLENELRTSGRILGVGFMFIGILFLAFACMRFFHAQVAMTQGYFPATRGMIIVTVASMLTAFISLLIVVYRESA